MGWGWELTDEQAKAEFEYLKKAYLAAVNLEKLEEHSGGTMISTATTPRSTDRMTILPSTAEGWLTNMVKNRKVNQRKVDFLARQMKEGNWKDNGDRIRFDNRGRLIDGQHRLQACIQTKIPLIADVVYGLGEDAMPTIDTGAGRSPGDVLSMNEVKNSSRIASAARWLLSFGDCAEGTAYTSNYTRIRSNQDILDCVKKHPGLEDSNRIFDKLRKGATAGVTRFGGFLVAMHYMTCGNAGKDKDQADKFLKTYFTGLGISEATDPVNHLRRAMDLNRKVGRIKGAPELAPLAIKAWNGWYLGKNVQVLRFGNKEAHPLPINFDVSQI